MMDAILLSVVVIVLLLGVIIFAIRMLNGGVTAGQIISVAVVVVLIGAGAGIIFGGDDKENEPDIFALGTIQYDDYVPCPSDISVDSGAVEVVIDGDQTYIHAIGTGEASVTSGDKQHTFIIEKAQLDVFMLAGQSNAEHGIYNRTDASPMGKMGTTYYYGTSSQVIRKVGEFNPDNYGIHDMLSSSSEAIAANVDLPFAATYYELTGHKVLVVNTGVAGSPVLSWTPGYANYIYAKAVFADAMSKIDTDYYEVSIEDYIWIQGEGDSGTSQTTYKSRFLAMHNSFIGADSDNVFYSSPFKSCLLSKVRYQNSANASAAQISLANSYSTIRMASTLADDFTTANGLMLPDDLHYSQIGDNHIGVEVAKYASKL